MSASITSSQGYSKDWEGRKEIWILRIPRDSNLIGLDESDEKIRFILIILMSCNISTDDRVRYDRVVF